MAGTELANNHEIHLNTALRTTMLPAHDEAPQGAPSLEAELLAREVVGRDPAIFVFTFHFSFSF